MTKALVACIRAYQAIGHALALFRIGPFGVSGCRHWPSCSEYGIDAIVRHGPLKGSVKALVRVVRCNPLVAA